MTNIDTILLVGLLVALGAASVSIEVCMRMRNEVDKCCSETQALLHVYEAFKKNDEDNYALMKDLHNLIDKVLEHDRQVIDENTKIMTEMAMLQARLEDMDDNS